MMPRQRISHGQKTVGARLLGPEAASLRRFTPTTISNAGDASILHYILLRDFAEDLVAADVKVIAGFVFTESILNRLRAIYEHSREIELTDVFGANYVGGEF